MREVTFHVIDPKCGKPFVDYNGPTVPHPNDDILDALDAGLLQYLDGRLVQHGDPYICGSCGRNLDEDLVPSDRREDPTIFPLHPANFKPAKDTA